MCNPERIPVILKKLEIWNEFPELRLGQLLAIVSPRHDLFYLEDSELEEELDGLIARMKQ